MFLLAILFLPTCADLVGPPSFLALSCVLSGEVSCVFSLALYVYACAGCIFAENVLDKTKPILDN